MESFCKILLLFFLAFAPISRANRNLGPDSLSHHQMWSPALIEKGGVSLGISEIIAEKFLFHGKPGELNLVEKMMQAWNGQIPQVPGRDMAFFQLPAPIVPNLEYSNIEDYNRDQTMGIYLHSRWFPNLSPKTLAITRLRMIEQNSGQYNQWREIVHADIILNNFHNKFRIYPPYVYVDNDNVKRFDLSTTILHELGHFLGLPHTEKSTRAVMYRDFGERQNKRNLTKYDSELLAKFYFTPSPFYPTFQTLEVPLMSYNSVAGTIELDIDGQCRHYQNDRLVKQHASDFGEIFK